MDNLEKSKTLFRYGMHKGSGLKSCLYVFFIWPPQRKYWSQSIGEA